MGPCGNLPDAVGAVPYGKHTGHYGHQRRCGADIGCCPFALDMLLARLQGQPVCGVAQTVFRGANDAAGEGALEFVACRHESGGRAPETHRQTHTLGAAHGNVGTPCGRFTEQCQREQVAVRSNQHSPSVGLFAEGGVVAHLAVGGRILQYGPETAFLKGISVEIASLHRDSECLGAGLDYREDVREYILIHKEKVASGGDSLPAAQVVHHAHRFCSGGGIVQHGAVGQWQTGHGGNHGLEYHQGLKPPLRYLRLIRGVRGVPGWILKNVAGNNGGCRGAVPAHSYQRTETFVLAGNLFEPRQVFPLSHGSIKLQRLLQQDVVRDGLLCEFFQG